MIGLTDGVIWIGGSRDQVNACLPVGRGKCFPVGFNILNLAFSVFNFAEIEKTLDLFQSVVYLPYYKSSKYEDLKLLFNSIVYFNSDLLTV